MVQEILVYIAVIFALLFLFRKYIFKSKKKGGDCDSDCNSDCNSNLDLKAKLGKKQGDILNTGKNFENKQNTNLPLDSHPSLSRQRSAT